MHMGTMLQPIRMGKVRSPRMTEASIHRMDVEGLELLHTLCTLAEANTGTLLWKTVGPTKGTGSVSAECSLPSGACPSVNSRAGEDQEKVHGQAKGWGIGGKLGGARIQKASCNQDSPGTRHRGSWPLAGLCKLELQAEQATELFCRDPVPRSQGVWCTLISNTNTDGGL